MVSLTVFYIPKTHPMARYFELPENTDVLISNLKNEETDDIVETISGLLEDLENKGIQVKDQSLNLPSSFRIKWIQTLNPKMSSVITL